MPTLAGSGTDVGHVQGGVCAIQCASMANSSHDPEPVHCGSTVQAPLSPLDHFTSLLPRPPAPSPQSIPHPAVLPCSESSHIGAQTSVASVIWRVPSPASPQGPGSSALQSPSPQPRPLWHPACCLSRALALTGLSDCMPILPTPARPPEPQCAPEVAESEQASDFLLDSWVISHEHGPVI